MTSASQAPADLRNKKVAYIVVGSHRSGTSAIARVLSLAGGALPKDILPPHPVDNPRGYWEPRLVVELNDAILAACGGDWRHPPRSFTASLEGFTEGARAVLAHQYPRDAPIVLKDPRISLIIPFWRDVLTSAGYLLKVVLMLRQPEQVAASLQRRGTVTYDEGLSLWATYTMHAERGSRGSGRIIVTFDDLLEDWRKVLGRLAIVVAPSAAASIDDFLSVDLAHKEMQGHSRLGDCNLATVYGLVAAADSFPAEPRLAELDAYWADVAAHASSVSLAEARRSPTPVEDAETQRGRKSRMQSDRFSWVLVTGAPRSGTSLLRAMLVEHPNAALLQEYSLTRLIRRVDDIVGGTRTRADWDTPAGPNEGHFERIAAFYRDRPGREAVTRGGGDPGPNNFDDVVGGLFSGMAPGKTLRLLGDKMPITRDWEDLALILERFPTLRFLIVIRNPADVVRSSLVRREATRLERDTWPIATVQEAIAQWILAWRQVRELVRDHGARVHVLKYEDLCSAPADVMRAAFAFLDLEPHSPQTPIASLPPGLRAHSNDEETILFNLLGHVIDAWPTHDAMALLEEFGSLREPYLFGDLVELSDESASEYLEGFSFREDWGRWTIGPHAKIRIGHGEARGLLLLEIYVSRLFRRGSQPCDIVLMAGWGEPKLVSLEEGEARVTFLARAEDAPTKGLFDVDLLVVRPKAPDELPADSRALGIGVSAFRLTRLPTPS